MDLFFFYCGQHPNMALSMSTSRWHHLYQVSKGRLPGLFLAWLLCFNLVQVVLTSLGTQSHLSFQGSSLLQLCVNDYRTMINVTYIRNVGSLCSKRSRGMFSQWKVSVHVLISFYPLPSLARDSRHCLPPVCIPDSKTCSSTAAQH